MKAGVATPPFAAEGDHAQFIQRLRDRDEIALARFFAENSRHLERVLMRVLGPDPELSDVVQDAFEQAILSMDGFRGDHGSLRAWVTRIGLNVAKNRLRYRRVRSWLGSSVSFELAEVASRSATPEVIEAMRRTYEVLAKLPADERIAFTLRRLDGMQLQEIAESTGASLATVKRRLARAKIRFERLAGRDPVLQPWLEGDA